MAIPNPIDPLEYMPLVKKIVNRIDIKLPSHWDKDDMISYGVIGLLDAIKRFKPDKEAKFSTFATIRIRGAIIDAVRKAAPVSRGKWESVRKITSAIEKFEQTKEGKYSLSKIAQEVNMSKKEVSEALESLNYFSHVSLEETLGLVDKSFKTPEENILKEERVEILSEALKDLKEKERLVLTLYYYEELSMKEVAEVLEISVSRASQIKTKALISLRKRLGDNI